MAIKCQCCEDLYKYKELNVEDRNELYGFHPRHHKGPIIGNVTTCSDCGRKVCAFCADVFHKPNSFCQHSPDQVFSDGFNNFEQFIKEN